MNRDRTTGSKRNGVRWGEHTEKNGKVWVAKDLLLGGWRELGLNEKQLIWLLTVLAHQYHTDNPPFVGHETLARYMGVGTKTSQRIGNDLEEKGLLVKLRRGKKPDGTRNSNGLDFSPLFRRLNEISVSRQKVRGKAPSDDSYASAETDNRCAPPMIEEPVGVKEEEPLVVQRRGLARSLTIWTGGFQFPRFSEADAVECFRRIEGRYPEVDVRQVLTLYRKSRRSVAENADKSVLEDFEKFFEKFVELRAKYSNKSDSVVSS